MDSNLRIGEVAEMLGVTTKTLRHYEKLGLIEPRRADNEYRLYTPEEVLRLQRIRQLQGLGLSLKRIRLILSEQTSEQVWTATMTALLEEIEAEIDVLEGQRERIAELLAQGLPDALEREIDPLRVPNRVEMYLDQHLSGPLRAQWVQERRMAAYLDGYPGQGERRAALRALLISLIEGADLYQRGLIFAALARTQSDGNRRAWIEPDDRWAGTDSLEWAGWPGPSSN